MTPRKSSTVMNVATIRQDFPIMNELVHGKHPLVYLDNAASTQHPNSVLAAMDSCYRTSYANVHRGIHELSERATELFEAARRKVATFVGVEDTGEIIITSGTTAAINVVARSWCEANLRAEDEILLTVLEHHSNTVPWQQAAKRVGARVIFSPVRDDGSFDLQAWIDLISPRTRLASFAAVSNVLGYGLPIREMVAAAKSYGVVTMLDAAQSVPHEPTNFKSLDVDFAAFSGHKMLGPSGVGILYGRRELLEAMPPFLGGGSMINRVTTDGFTPGELPAKFEAGTPPIVEAVGLGAAIDYLSAIGLPEVVMHEQRLAQRARKLLHEIPGLKFLLTHAETPSGIISFHFPKLAAQDVAILLDRKGIAVRAGHHCAMPLHDRFHIPASLRASFYLYNTEAEVDLFAERLAEVVEKLSA
ncbi:MAG: SufS family cysteine desulfurase [Pirellulaceae bacterium]